MSYSNYKAHMIKHLVLSWWHRLGRYETFSGWSLAEGSTSWGCALRVSTQVPLCSPSLCILVIDRMR